MPMLSLVVTLALGAAPARIEVVSAHLTDAQLHKLLPDRTIVQATDVYDYLFAPHSMMGMQDFGSFHQGPPAGWPSQLDSVWASGVATCGAMAGSPPWIDNFPIIYGCAKNLSLFLWEQYLQQKSATHVLILQAGENTRTHQWEVTGFAYGVNDSTALTDVSTGAITVSDALNQGVVDNLLAGKGKSVQRERAGAPTQRSKADPWAKEAKVSTAVELGVTCDALPAALKVTPPSVLADSIAARWSATVHGQGAPVDCSLATFEGDESISEGPKISVVYASLNCGPHTALSGLKRDGIPGGPIGSMSATLMKKLAPRFCPKK